LLPGGSRILNEKECCHWCGNYSNKDDGVYKEHKGIILWFCSHDHVDEWCKKYKVVTT